MCFYMRSLDDYCPGSCRGVIFALAWTMINRNGTIYLYNVLRVDIVNQRLL